MTGRKFDTGFGCFKHLSEASKYYVSCSTASSGPDEDTFATQSS